MNKSIILIVLIIVSIFLTSCESESDKLEKIETERKIEEEEKQKKLEKRYEYNEKKKNQFLDSLNKQELKIYEEYSPDYMITLYKKNLSTGKENISKRIFTHTYPKDKYFAEPGKCIEYNDVLNGIKRNKEKEFCKNTEQNYKITNLRFHSNY